ncbi:MAG TPA: ATP-binding protein [Anaeromyxobacter sp.]|nr:ATP-binding protein [Anaeromyxobacter sp.]
MSVSEPAAEAPRRTPHRVRLWVKVAVLAGLAVVGTHAVHLVVGGRVATRALAHEQMTLGRAIARLVAAQAADAVLTEDAVTLHELVVSAARDRGIAYCFVVRDGRVLATSFPGQTPPALAAIREGRPPGPLAVVDGSARYLDLEEPILGGRAGTVRLGIDMAMLRSVRRSIAVPLGLTALGAVLLSIAMALVIGRRLARPIDEIVAAADRFDPALPAKAIRPRGSKEIATLAVRFNEMMERLRAAHEERERVSARAVASERLATLGSLVAGVAHEVNNPLASLKGAIEDLRERGANASDRVEDLDLADGAVDRIADVVRRLLDFGRNRPLAFEAVIPEALAHDSAKLAAISLKQRGISIEEVGDPAAERAPVIADRKQVAQALMNLLLNAAYVSKDHGKVRVRLRRRGAFRGIAVEDDGPGIPEELRERIFEPFFSTKPPGQGTGLGLPLARAIAEAHSGSLELEFPESGGTVATIWLPAAEPACAAPQAVPRAAEAKLAAGVEDAAARSKLPA